MSEMKRIYFECKQFADFDLKEQKEIVFHVAEKFNLNYTGNIRKNSYPNYALTLKEQIEKDNVDINTMIKEIVVSMDYFKKNMPETNRRKRKSRFIDYSLKHRVEDFQKANYKMEDYIYICTGSAIFGALFCGFDGIIDENGVEILMNPIVKDVVDNLTKDFFNKDKFEMTHTHYKY